MDLKLSRTDFIQAGIFGVMTDTNEKQIGVTLEHSYPGSNLPISYIPKIPPGVYTCVRGIHQLVGMSTPFETFEITNVPGHTNILIHVGNTNVDSSGCVLLGTSRSGNMILESRLAFGAFMQMQAGVNAFALIVE